MNSMYGLIGYPLSHSFSKDFFNRKFAVEKIPDAGYENFPLEDINEFPILIQENPELRGLNVTIPYKEQILPFLDQIDPCAAEIGAVNTIKFETIGNQRIIKGYNTDEYGFSRSLAEFATDTRQIHYALILGTGGASKAVAYTLKKLNIPFEFVSSSGKSGRSYESLDKATIQRSTLIINTSPLGMYPKVSDCPAIPYEYINMNHLLFDLIYNPDVTLFLKKGKEKGARICNGLKMLEYQAIKAWEIWNS